MLAVSVLESSDYVVVSAYLTELENQDLLSYAELALQHACARIVIRKEMNHATLTVPNAILFVLDPNHADPQVPELRAVQ